MSLSRCVSSTLRSQRALQKFVVPAISVVNTYKGNEVDYGRTVCLPTSQSEVRLSRYYSSSKGAKAMRYTRSDSSDSSDSDREKRPGKRYKRGQTSFWRQKMRTHHQMMDVNKDGVVSWDDFDALVRKFAQIGHLSEKEIGRFSDALRHVWEEEWGASGDPYAFIGQEQFLTQMEHVVNTKDLRKRVASPLQYFFKAVDHDNSGEISLEEFKLFYSCLGLSNRDAEISFAAIDLNNDGRLSIKEFIKLGRDFFLSEDENRPSKLFWGPLSK